MHIHTLRLWRSDCSYIHLAWAAELLVLVCSGAEGDSQRLYDHSLRGAFQWSDGLVGAGGAGGGWG